MSALLVLPFTEHEQAAEKVQIAEDPWNTRDPEKVAAAHAEDTECRNEKNFYGEVRPSSSFFVANGTANWGTS